MYRSLRVVAITCVLDEEKKIGEVVRRVPRDVVDEIFVIDDGSKDRSAEVARAGGATVVSFGSTIGVGAGLRVAYRHALDAGFDVAVTMAGNNKDSPEEIPVLLDPIAGDRADFVQGSRFLKKNADFGPMPAYRKLATRLHAVAFSAVAGQRITESTNGFRAVHRRILADPRLDLSARWLDEYELEPYLFLRSIRLGYRIAEVPVTKIYPPKALGQTKMKPIVGWWSILKPLVYLSLGIKK